jgi:UDP-N-acetylmuramate--alanine ligase
VGEESVKKAIGKQKETKMDISTNKVFHFIGIGGSGMSAIARVLLLKGFKVSGSDVKENANTIRLRDCGAKIFFGHKESNLRSADIIVVSTAIPQDNEELVIATYEKLPIYKRAEILNFIMQFYPKRIAISGTHGKTTTTSMTARMFEALQIKPTYLIGGELVDYGGNAAVGGGDYVIAEADESDGSFLMIHSNIAVVTNIEAEHLSYFKTEERLLEHFRQFMDSVLKSDGYLVLNKDDSNVAALSRGLKNVRYFSINEKSDVMAKDIQYTPSGTRFTLFIEGKSQGQVYLKVHGNHNVYNALAAITIGVSENLSVDLMKKGLMNFLGAKRRFQFIGERNGVSVYDDYGHHPTEIKVTLESIKKSMGCRIVCIFQPHRYSRTQEFLETFPTSFDSADLVVITEVFSANEEKIEGISGEVIVEKINQKSHPEAVFIEQKGEIAFKIMPELKKGDLVITMGAGDIFSVGKEIYARLKNG